MRQYEKWAKEWVEINILDEPYIVDQAMAAWMAGFNRAVEEACMLEREELGTLHALGMREIE